GKGYVIGLSDNSKTSGIATTIYTDLPRYEVVREQGGPKQFYRPLENAALWRQFADRCHDKTGVLEFTSEFGLLDRHQSISCDEVFAWAKLMRAITGALDTGDKKTAAKLFSESVGQSEPGFYIGVPLIPPSYQIRTVPTKRGFDL